MLREVSSQIAAAGKVLLEELHGVVFKTYKFGDHNCASRILFVAYALTPTLQLSFIRPLKASFDSSDLSAELLSEQQILARFGGHRRENAIHRWIRSRVQKMKPSVIVFSRYSGRYTEFLMQLARSLDIRTIFHIDDDLLNVPQSIGQQKFNYHNQPMRLANVRYLLRHCDLIYCSTESLRKQLAVHGDTSRFIAGRIYCSGTIIRSAELKDITTIGYMGFDHDNDFRVAIPALIAVMRKYSNLTFELFGSISRPLAFEEFGERVRVHPPVRNYESFLQALADRRWDIGICPLADTAFNHLKANTKWVEYTAVGAAVVASAGIIYDECCSNDRGILAANTEDWIAAFEKLINDNEARYKLVANAQMQLQNTYSIENLRQQVLQVLKYAHDISPNRLKNLLNNVV